MAYTTPQWAAWGLCIVDAVRLNPEEHRLAVRSHQRVADYLDTHADVASRYRADQSGEIKVCDVMALVEAADGD